MSRLPSDVGAGPGTTPRLRLRTDAGASAVEYGLLVAGVAAVLVAALFLFGGMVRDTLAGSCTTISLQTSPGTDCTG